MYKFSFFIVLFLTSVTLSTAQTQEEEALTRLNKMFIGIQCGPVFRIPTTLYKDSDYKIDELPSCTFGLSFQHNFSKRFTFRTELNYEKVTSRYSVYTNRILFYEFTASSVPALRSTPYTVTYSDESFTFPVLMKFNLIAQEKNTLFVDAGTVVNHFFRSYVAVRSDTENNSGKRHMSNYMLGGFFGLGYDRKLDSRMHLTIEARNNTLTYLRDWRLLIGFAYRL
ncbi:MAG TPA: outer membrane beta-barrel protein [Bacteroidia bacterium]|jgi:hypothetical protein|nr:outer membrane beta-barrel protein [Bacteroidia bacterium]